MLKNTLKQVVPLLSLLIGTLLLQGTRPTQAASFQEWLNGVKKEAAREGISQKTIGVTLDNLQLIPKVIELDQKQPELKWTLETYLGKVVPQSRILEGREKLAEHRILLQKISEQYGVPERFLIAFWGIETDYGRLGGVYPVMDAVATLAFEGRRAAFFRRELLHALHIVDEGRISARKMNGSWAGAMGQIQFMPSSFRSYAVDFGGDGQIDIWSDLGDVFASAANYLRGCGWVKGENWGEEVRLPDGFDRNLIGLDIRKPLSAWKALGVLPQKERNADGLSDGQSASVLQPDGPGGEAFIVYENYRVILKWNRSNLFAIAVGTLADQIGRSEGPH